MSEERMVSEYSAVYSDHPLATGYRIVDSNGRQRGEICDVRQWAEAWCARLNESCPKVFNRDLLYQNHPGRRHVVIQEATG